MANLSFGVDGPTMQFTVSMAIADSDATRILAYLAASDYGRVSETVDGVTSTRAATTEECARAFAAGILRGLLDQTVTHERNVAAKAAAELITPITVA